MNTFPIMTTNVPVMISPIYFIAAYGSIGTNSFRKKFSIERLKYDNTEIPKASRNLFFFTFKILFASRINNPPPKEYHNITTIIIVANNPNGIFVISVIFY